ncbi:MAG: tetratricopeptide repeat protein [Nitrospinae bacterium]|nr:tetratricopeptide repeat protein [Nitrospinota bacterium]
MATARMALHGLSSLEQYGDMLEADTAQGRLEREELISHFAVGESYFFRDKGQFDLLKHKIFPELIERNKTGRTLNILSAGCATGEEPYSLAILLSEIIPDIAEWRVHILGTDIKEEFLEKARTAVYSEWSFRMVPEEVRKKYFTRKGGLFTLDPGIKRMVTFHRGNLLDAVFPEPAGQPRGLDLILCRNVLIYYRRTMAAAIVIKMTEALREGGYLITGHWELFSSPLGILAPRVFPESFAYQRVAEGPAQKPIPPVPHLPVFPVALKAIMPRTPSSTHDTVREPQAVLTDVHTLFNNAAYRKAVALLEKELRKAPEDFQALCLAAHAYANLGEHGRAVELLRKAIDVDPLSAEPYALLAHIAEENGDADAAKGYLEKVIYLYPALVSPYLDLSAIHENMGEAEKARKMRQAALSVLKGLPKESIVEPYGTTAADLVHHMELLLLR